MARPCRPHVMATSGTAEKTTPRGAWTGGGSQAREEVCPADRAPEKVIKNLLRLEGQPAERLD
jgi:hypothetical protein